MGFYERVVFPRINDFALSHPNIVALRKEALAPAHGHVLEIGIGSGLNLPSYPVIDALVGIDPNPAMRARAERRAASAPFPLDVRDLSGESLPLDDASIDTVVTTFVLCTIDDVPKALSEIRRVLKPNGQYLMLEHGLSDEPKVQRWQHRLNPLQRVVGCGCNLDRDVRTLVESAGFRFAQLRAFALEGMPKTHGYVYLGRALRA